MTEQRQGAAAHAARPRHPERPCLNCGDPTFGEYCPRCGQHKVDVQVSVSGMVKDVLEDEFLLGRRLPHTLIALLFRPGFLTDEVLKGRIVRYVRPFKLYLASSVVFFLMLSFVSLRALEEGGVTIERDEEGASDVTGADLAGLDSAIAELDAQLQEPGVNPQAAAAITRVRASLSSQRERMAAESDSAPPVLDSLSRSADSAAAAPTGVEDDREGDLPEIRTGIARVDSVLAARMRRWEELPPEEVWPEIARSFLAYVPTLMFLLLPVFAGVLKLLYVRQGRYYAEHMIFVLHTHAFIFAIFTLMFLARQWIGGWPLALLLLWVFAYIYMAMRRVYGQSRTKTFLKYWTLGWMYFWILLIGIPLLFVVTIFLVPA